MIDNNEIEIRNALSAIRKTQLTQISKTHAIIDVTSFVGPVGRGPDRDEDEIDFYELKIDYISTTHQNGKTIVFVEDYKIVYGEFTNGLRVFTSDYPDITDPVNNEIAKDAIIEYFRESYYDDCIILFEDEQ